MVNSSVNIISVASKSPPSDRNVRFTYPHSGKASIQVKMLTAGASGRGPP